MPAWESTAWDAGAWAEGAWDADAAAVAEYRDIRQAQSRKRAYQQRLKMGLTLDAMSSTGTRDIVIDFTPTLETSEVISSVTVVSANPLLLAISNEAVNTVEIVQDGITSAIGKAVTFSVTGMLAGTVWDAKISIDYTGDAGSSDDYEVTLPIQSKLTV